MVASNRMGFMMRIGKSVVGKRIILSPVALGLLTSGLLVRAGQSATVAWEPSGDSNVVGYVLYHGVTGTSYLEITDVGNQTAVTLTNLLGGITNSFAVTAYNADHIESEPSVLLETNFPGAYPPPTIAAVADQTIGTNSAAGPLSLTIGDALFSPSDLKISAVSSNTTLVPTGNILFGGSGSDRTVTVIPASKQSGSTLITLTVDDGLASANTSFRLTVDPTTLSEWSYFLFEGESATLAAPMEISADPLASGAKCIATSSFGLGPAKFTVNVPAAAAYTMWWRAAALKVSLYPFIVVVDGEGSDVFHARGVTTNGWQWTAVRGSFQYTIFEDQSADRTVVPLTAGQHYISIWGLDPAMRLDELLLTNDRSFVPAPPALTVPADQKIDELALLAVTNTATAASPSANALTFSLNSAPNGVTLDPVTGALTWTPSEEQGPSTNLIAVQVTDNGVPPLSDVRSFMITVNEVNSPPVLEGASAQLARPDSLLTVAMTASDPDLPPNQLAFSLDPGAPAGATIDPSSGVFSWTPSVDQVGQFNVTVRVTDNGSPPLSATTTLPIVVTTLPPIVLTSVGMENQTFRLSVSGAPGLLYSVQVSTNLTAWSTVADLNPVGPVFEWVDTNAVNYPFRFYRLLVHL